MPMTPPQVVRTTAELPGKRRRIQGLVLLVACFLQLSAGVNAWADEPEGPPVAEPNLPPPPDGPPPEPAARAPAAPAPAAPAPAPVAAPAPAPARAAAPVAGPADAMSPEQAATLDAEADTSGVLWFIAGCIGTWIGVLVAYVASPSPPYSRLAGKPPEYASRYAVTYEVAGRGEQTRLALYGCGATLVTYAVVLAYTLSTPSGGL